MIPLTLRLLALLVLLAGVALGSVLFAGLSELPSTYRDIKSEPKTVAAINDHPQTFAKALRDGRDMLIKGADALGAISGAAFKVQALALVVAGGSWFARRSARLVRRSIIPLAAGVSLNCLALAVAARWHSEAMALREAPVPSRSDAVLDELSGSQERMLAEARMGLGLATVAVLTCAVAALGVAGDLSKKGRGSVG